MPKFPSYSRNLKIICGSWNINPSVSTWAEEQTACVRARQSGTLELMQHNPSLIKHAAGPLIHSLCLLYGNGLQTARATLRSSAAVYHQIWIKRLLWSSCRSGGHSICVFKTGTGYFKGSYKQWGKIFFENSHWKFSYIQSKIEKKGEIKVCLSTDSQKDTSLLESMWNQRMDGWKADR